MDDFIKRSDALKVIETANSMVSGLLEATMKLCVTMDRIAAADVVPVRHGRWIVKGQDIYCSECNAESAYNPFGASKFSVYCPTCGALMDKDGDGE